MDQRRQVERARIATQRRVGVDELLIGCVQVEAGAEAEVPSAIRVARHAGAARAGVGGDEGEAELGGEALGAGLLHEVLVGTGQPGQPVQGRQRRLRLGLGRQVDGEDHLAVQGPGKMTVTLVPAAEGLLAADQFEGILHVTSVKRSWRAAGPAATACQ